MLLGVTAMSLLTTPLVIMTSIHFLAKDGHPPVLLNIAGTLQGARAGRQNKVWGERARVGVS